jgi:hypothetical protein
MWPRVAEILMGIWLLTSPWVLARNPDVNGWLINGLACGSAIVVLSALSFWSRSSKAHLAEIPVGLWILGFSYFSSAHPAPPIAESGFLTALFLLNFAIIPSHANLPPISWREMGKGGSGATLSPVTK